MLEFNHIYNQDCLEGMAQMDNQSVHMICCDLPYGITQNSWDSIIPIEKLWEQYKRIIKPKGAIVLTASQPFTSTLVTSNLAWFKYEWIWHKNNATGFLNVKRMPMKEHESILVFSDGIHTYNPQGLKPFGKVAKHGRNSTNYGTSKREFFQEVTGYPKTILKFDVDLTKFHPTQKPIALFEYLIRTYTNLGDIVLDNCMGSGTTAIAAIQSNRQYIGFELNPEYYKDSQQRIKTYTKPKASLSGLYFDDETEE